jgi:hypothetical protein
MEAVEKLDIVLQYVHDNSQVEGYTDGNFIYHYLKTNYPDVSNWQVETFPMIKRLEKDGFVNYQFTQTPIQNPQVFHTIQVLQQHRVYITFDGSMFLEKGGYITQQRKEANKERLKNIERILLTGGTVFAGIYGVFEIMKYFLLKRHIYLTIEYATLICLFAIGILTGIAIMLLAKEVLKRTEK